MPHDEEVNPYAAPRSSSDAVVVEYRRPSWRTVFFVVNFVGGGLLLILCVYSIASGDEYDSVGGAMLALVVAVYLLGECVAFLGRKRSLEHLLGYVNAGAGLLFTFGFVVNSYQAMADSNGVEWGLMAFLVALFVPTAGYLLACGLFRIGAAKRID